LAEDPLAFRVIYSVEYSQNYLKPYHNFLKLTSLAINNTAWPIHNPAYVCRVPFFWKNGSLLWLHALLNVFVHVFIESKVLYLTHFWSDYAHLTTDGKVHDWPVNWESIWHCFALLSLLNIVYHSVFIQFAWFNLQMRSILLAYHLEMLVIVWHCLFIDQSHQKDCIRVSFHSIGFI